MKKEQNTQNTVFDNAILSLVKDCVSAGKTVTLPLRGISMRPYLEDDRDAALLSAVPETLRRGDVIFAYLPSRDSFVLHRITSVKGDNIVMCGDGNLLPEFVRRQNVIAIAIGFYRNGSTKLDSVGTIAYQTYWRVWLFLKPIRRWLLLVWQLYHYPTATLASVKAKITKS